MNITEKESALLINEGYLASSSINHGLTSLRKATVAQKGEFYLAFFNLSIGLERLMKLIIIQDFRAKNSHIPDNKYIRSYSHNLEKLFETCRVIGEEHTVIAKSDQISLEILKMLSDFSQSTRYYNLDYITGKNHAENPLERWSEIQSLLMNSYYVDKPMVPVQIKELFEFIDEISVTMASNMNATPYKKASDYLFDIEGDRKIQGYAVYHIFILIVELVEILRAIEYSYNLYPCLREFFEQFHGHYKLSEIVRKKKWTY